MLPETQAEYPYFVKIETVNGPSATVPIVFLTATQVEKLFCADFQRLVQEAGITGASVHLERAATADYETVLGEIAACLRNARTKVA